MKLAIHRSLPPVLTALLAAAALPGAPALLRNVVPPAAAAAAPEATVKVRDAEGLRRAVAAAGPGARIVLEPGEYAGGFHFAGLRGEPGKPVVLAGADPKRPPVIRGGGSGIHLTDPAHVELCDLEIREARGNGINIDDGGSYETPAHHVVLRRLKVSDIGTGGNQDGIKLSGMDDFLVEECVIERWGTGGSGIDMVGCHRGMIAGNHFRHSDEQRPNGVQTKGGSSEITIRDNRFEQAGGRAVNIGGSTGLEFFRPALREGAAGERWEARDIRVEGNTFIGSGAAAAFVGVDGAVFRFNTVYRPKRWAFRILQENQAAGFVASRKGEITDNIIVLDAGQWRSAFNIGPHTAPATFRLARNFWYAPDRPVKTPPDLPVKEEKGTYGEDPRFVDAEKGDLRLRPDSRARGAGAEARPR
jgi:hypothetical protein